MKYLRTLKNLTLSVMVFVFFQASVCWSEKMDSATQDGVVLRLERILAQLSERDGAWVESHIRLADILAERARTRFMAEVEKNCEECLGSKKDREKAIHLYENVLNRSNHSEREVALFQLAHLYLMKRDSKTAKRYFQELIEPKNHFDSYRVARANEGLADIEYKNKKFAIALGHYQSALHSNQLPNRGFLAYRSAWCQFNMGKIENGIATLENLLSTKNLLVRKGTNGDEYDPVFHSDVMKDLAIFYSRTKISDTEINKYISFLPEDTEVNQFQKELLLHFAVETERVGNREASFKIIQHYMKYELTSEETLEAWMMLATINYGMGQFKSAILDYDKVTDQWKKKGCSDEARCPALKIKLRNFVTEFHRSQKLQPNANLVKAYSSYCGLFVDDSKMALTGAQVARVTPNLTNQFDIATRLFHQAAVEAHKKNEIETLDKALEGVIEIAERANNLDLREKAYLFFLELKPNDPRSYSVKYQLAHVEYERKKYDIAAEKFRLLALEKSSPSKNITKDDKKEGSWSTSDKSLKKKSADLALDSLVIQKADLKIEKMALEFANEFPADRLEFIGISRKATVNIVANITNRADSSTSDLEQSLNKLKAASLDGSSVDERKKILNNQFLLAKRIPKLVDAEMAIVAFLQIKEISTDEKEEALSRLVWIYEMRFEFRSAYKVAQRMSFKGLPAADKELRLGTLAELAGLNPRIHYMKFISSGKNDYQSAVIRAHLVEISENSFQEFVKQKSALRAFPQLLSDVVIAVYLRAHDVRFLKEFATLPVVGQLVAVMDMEILSKKIEQMRLLNSNDRILKTSIKERLNALASADNTLRRPNNDWLIQLMAFSVVARENERLYDELISLPVPRKVKANQKAKYMQLIQAQALPYRQKSELANQKLQEIWSTPGALDKISAQVRESGGRGHAILVEKISRANSVINKNLTGGGFASLLSNENGRPTIREIEVARDRVKSEPFAVGEIERLKTFEDRMGHQVMVTYLDSRIKALQLRAHK